MKKDDPVLRFGHERLPSVPQIPIDAYELPWRMVLELPPRKLVKLRRVVNYRQCVPYGAPRRSGLWVLYAEVNSLSTTQIAGPQRMYQLLCRHSLWGHP